MRWKGWQFKWGGDDQTPPVFKGIILAYSPQKDKINLHWAQASDDVTQLDKIKYNIYASPLNDIDTIYQDANFLTSLVNQTNYSIENLTPGQTYYCLVVAEDEHGNRNQEHKIFEVSTMPDALQTQMIPKDMISTDITAVTNSEDNFTFTGVDANDLTSNDIIIVDNELGQILKKVVSTEITETGVTVTTEDASLSEVIKSGVLKSSVLLTDLNDIPSSQEITLKTTIAGKVQTMPAKQYNDPDGFFKVTESISDNHYLPHRTLRKSRFGLYEHETSLNESVKLGYTINFTPGIETEARYTESWGVDPAEYVKVVAKGMISIDALAGYYLNGESKLSLKKQLLNRGITLTYSVGPVPVYQEIYLEIFAELNMDANANLTMETNLKASKDIEIGVEWDREKGWNTIRNEGFDQEITFNVEAGGTVVGTLKVYPVISVRFYKAAKSSLYVVPTLALDSAARIIPPPFELTKFDVNFLVDSYIAANLKVLGWVLAEWESDHYELLNIPIFSLPEITLQSSSVSLSAGITQKYSLTIEDGVHNTIRPENIEWSVEPNVGVTLEPINGNTEAILSALSEGEYTVKVSAYGDGFLGTIGTRYASFPLTVIGVSDTTLNVDINGTGSGTVTSLPEGINCGTVCSASFTNSSSVTLTATPASGSTFSSWSGECAGTGTCTVVMDRARSVTATFEMVGLAPSAPTNVTGMADDGQVTISWDAVSGAESYNLYMASESGVTKSNYSTLTDGMKHIGVISPYTHTGLANGKVYYFVITAVNTYGESTESNQISTTPVAPLSSNEIILFISLRDGNWEVYRMNGDGSKQNNLSNDPAIDSSPAYSPDGNKIVFVSTRECSEGKLYVMNSDSTNVDRLPVGFSNAPDGSVFCEPFVLSSPKYSPDGTKIVFRGNVVPGGPSPGNTQIYIMDSDGSNIINLSNNSFFDKDPVFTPDGQKIVFSSYRDGNYEIYIMNIDGSNQIRLTNEPGDDELPGISPDGSKITFTSNRDGNYEIYVMDIDGNNQINLTNSSAADGNSMFSPDGSQIAFISNRDGNCELYLMNSNGTELYRLTNTLADELQPFFRWNPSGNQFPIVQINSPESFSSFIHGSSVTFSGTSLDPEDGIMQGASLVWSSNKDGKIGEGVSFSVSNLLANTHVITLIATDSQGATSTSSTTITIHPSPTGITALAGDRQVTISWNTISGSDSYNLYMAMESGISKINYSTLADGMKHTGVTSPYTHTGLTNGKTYYFVVTAVNSGGESIESIQVSAIPTDRVTPTIAAASYHTCAILSEGGVKCWGQNIYGQLGDGTYTNSLVPTAVSGLVAATAVVTGQEHTCALLPDGTVNCWGDDWYGELGNGTNGPSSTPVRVSKITTATAIAAGVFHTCALLSDGTVQCWGANYEGQLGNGTNKNNIETPVEVSGITTAIGIATGSGHTCAVLADGKVKCWGRNTEGQIGNGTHTDSSTPVEVSGITSATAIVAGSIYTCARLSDGTVQCWGNNAYGYLGNGTTTESTTPVTVSGITTAITIAAWGSHTCAILSDGTVNCWGSNWSGQFGDGTTGFSSTPVEVSGITTATAIAAGSAHTCARLSDGTVQCWGNNQYGQLGNGTTSNSSIPTIVSGF